MEQSQFDAWTIWEHEQTLEALEKSYRCREFRKDLKRAWSFKCSMCEKKISSKTHNEYWGFSHQASQNINMDIYRFCSKECGDVIYYDLYQRYLNKMEVLKQKYR